MLALSHLKKLFLPGVVIILLLFPVTAAASSGDGALSVKVIGLPRGEKGSLSITGPSRADGRTTHRLVVVGARTLTHLRPGAYLITVAKARIRHPHQGIKRGATASPTARHVKVRVRSHRVAKAEIHYGTIVNPGVVSVSGHLAQVIGDPTNPTEVVLRHIRGVHRGNILSARPSRVLPNGLLARAVSVSRQAHSIRVRLRSAGIYEVAPNMAFDIPLSPSTAAQISSGLQCGAGGSSISPYAHISDVHLTGRWVTSHVLFADITNGATVELHFKVSVGLNVATGASLSCSVSLPAFGVEGMAGPIPVYGAIKPTASGQIAGQAILHAQGSTEVTMGGTVTVPGVPHPIVGFGSPQFSFSSQIFAGVNASISLDAELGIGAADIASLHLGIDNSLDFGASPGNCSWDLNLGSFALVGSVGPFSISSPSTPPVYHHNLWHNRCGSSPAPPPPPEPSGPLVRATMSWDTDSDIDLYTWDSEGHVLFYGERFGIPNAELVEHVIPLEGEFEHNPEVFQETAEFNRPYTFGICDYHGEGADVTLTVVDPGGGARTFHRTLEYEGDGAVITSSPAGADYAPPGEWCQYASEFGFE